MLMLPDEFMPEDFKAERIADLRTALLAATPTETSGQLALTITAGDKKSSGLLVWPLSAGKNLFAPAESASSSAATTASASSADAATQSVPASAAPQPAAAQTAAASASPTPFDHRRCKSRHCGKTTGRRTWCSRSLIRHVAFLHS